MWRGVYKKSAAKRTRRTSESQQRGERDRSSFRRARLGTTVGVLGGSCKGGACICCRPMSDEPQRHSCTLLKLERTSSHLCGRARGAAHTVFARFQALGHTKIHQMSPVWTSTAACSTEWEGCEQNHGQPSLFSPTFGKTNVSS